MQVQGWAVTTPNKIFIKTVSDTRRSAIVNFLVSERSIAVSNAWTDQDIEIAWRHWGGNVICRQVLVVLWS